MNIYIMRHGAAEMMAQSDSSRELTQNGILDSKVMAKRLADRQVIFDAAMVSPFVRAQQTFAVVSDYFPKISKVATHQCLTPSGSISETMTEIDALFAIGAKSLLIVSHLPLVGYLVGQLIPSAGNPGFSTSAIAHIELLEEGGSVLHRFESVFS